MRQAFYVVLARREAAAKGARRTHCFGPFFTFEQARLIRTSALSLGLVAADRGDQAQVADEPKEVLWQRQANM